MITDQCPSAQPDKGQGTRAGDVQTPPALPLRLLGSPAGSLSPTFKAVMIVLMFATMGASIAWVFERLPPDIPFAQNTATDGTP